MESSFANITLPAVNIRNRVTKKEFRPSVICIDRIRGDVRFIPQEVAEFAFGLWILGGFPNDSSNVIKVGVVEYRANVRKGAIEVP